MRCNAVILFYFILLYFGIASIHELTSGLMVLGLAGRGVKVGFKGSCVGGGCGCGCGCAVFGSGG